MSIENKKVGIDIDNDGKPDLNLDLKTLIILIGGIASLIFTYTTLQAEIEEAKKLPPHEDHSKIDQQMKFLENKLANWSYNRDKKN